MKRSRRIRTEEREAAHAWRDSLTERSAINRSLSGYYLACWYHDDDEYTVYCAALLLCLCAYIRACTNLLQVTTLVNGNIFVFHAVLWVYVMLQCHCVTVWCNNNAQPNDDRSTVWKGHYKAILMGYNAYTCTFWNISTKLTKIFSAECVRMWVCTYEYIHIQVKNLIKKQLWKITICWICMIKYREWFLNIKHIWFILDISNIYIFKFYCDKLSCGVTLHVWSSCLDITCPPLLHLH